MEITISYQQASEPIAIMHLKGDLDAATMTDIVNKAHELHQNPARFLILDLSEVPYISSAGIVAIHNIALYYSGGSKNAGRGVHPNETHSHDARKFVKLLNPQPGVDHTLEISGLKLFFKVFKDLDTAVKSF